MDRLAADLTGAARAEGISGGDLNRALGDIDEYLTGQYEQVSADLTLERKSFRAFLSLRETSARSQAPCHTRLRRSADQSSSMAIWLTVSRPRDGAHSRIHRG